jgi:hypothetical protein
MRLLFDPGTRVLAESPDLRRKSSPGILCRRVELYRAPAYRYAEVLESIRALGLPLADEVQKPAKAGENRSGRHRYPRWAIAPDFDRSK